MNAPKTVNVDGTDRDCVAVAHSWLDSAFDVAFGSSRSELCRRFSDDLRTLLTAQKEISGSEFVDQVQAIQWRLSVAAEWALRLEKAEDAQ